MQASGQGFYNATSSPFTTQFQATGGIDPFNYPMPSRKDLMSLSTIDANKDFMKTTTRKFATRRFDSTNLNTNDIQGASPKIHGSKVVNKPEFQNTNWDIARSSPAALHIGLNKPQANLSTKDIEGASPKCVQFTTYRVGSNPLDPVYELPQVETRPITPPRYIRDQMDVTDIHGAFPKRAWHVDARTKETNKIDDIQGTKAHMRHSPRKNSAGYTSYDYTDVTKAHFNTKRIANPMNPSYTIRDENGKLFEIGEIEGNKPVTLPPARKRGDVNLTLKTQDINGATSGTKGLGVFAENHIRREVRRINQTDDIEGAQGGSLKRGTISTRATNPLDPKYQFPGDTELVDPCSAYSKPKTDLRESKQKLSTIQQSTAKEALKKSTTLDPIPEATGYTKIEVSKLYQASRGAEDRFQNIKNNAQAIVNVNSSTFKRDSAAFHGHDYEVSSQGSIFKKNAAQFYGVSAVQEDPQPVGVNKTTSVYKRDAAKFFGHEYEVSSQGSIFRKNEAHFLGLPTPNKGERPSAKEQTTIAVPQGVSVLNERKLREHEEMIMRDPNYAKNQKRFFGLPSHHTVQRSASSVQKFDHFISKV